MCTDDGSMGCSPLPRSSSYFEVHWEDIPHECNGTCPKCGSPLKEGWCFYYDTVRNRRASGKPFVGYLCPNDGAVNEDGQSLLR